MGLETRFVGVNPYCAAQWPEAAAGEYNPACCRFPKSCSADLFEMEPVVDWSPDEAELRRQIDQFVVMRVRCQSVFQDVDSEWKAVVRGYNSRGEEILLKLFPTLAAAVERLADWKITAVVRRRPPEPEVPHPHDCESCGMSYEACTERCRSEGRGCCSACYTNEQHGQLAWERQKWEREGSPGSVLTGAVAPVAALGDPEAAADGAGVPT